MRARAARTRATARLAACACACVLATLALGGCARSAFEQQLRAGRLPEAAVAFERDSTLQRNPKALRAAARLHLNPGDPFWDPPRALELLMRARELERGPNGDDAVLERVLRAYADSGEAQGTRERVLRDSLATTRRALEVATRAAARLQEQAAANDEERALMQRLVTRLEADLRDRETQLALLRLELDRLKAIDLTPGRSPRAP
jgi:hypothetical protein